MPMQCVSAASVTTISASSCSSPKSRTSPVSTWCFVSCRSSFSAMFVTIWMCTQEWSLISMRATAFTFATCHQPLSWVSALTRSISVRSLRLPRTGTLMRIRSTASAGVRRASCSASSDTGCSIRSAVSLSIAMRRSIRPATGHGRIRHVSAQAPALRPLGIGEILDVGIKIYFRNAWTLFRLVLFVVLPAQILSAVIRASALPSGSDTFGLGFGSSTDTVTTDDAWTAAVGFMVATIIGALAGKLAQAGCFRAVADAYLGEPVSWRESLRYALKRLPVVVGVTIVSTIFVAIGVIFCIVPGIYLWAGFYVAIPVVLVEGVGPFRALGRSRELVRGRWWGTFGVAVLGS